MPAAVPGVGCEANPMTPAPLRLFAWGLLFLMMVVGGLPGLIKTLLLHGTRRGRYVGGRYVR